MKRAAFVLLLCLAIFLPRLLNLGTILTTDEPLWQGRSQLFVKSLATLDLARTATSIQPGVTTTWVGALASPFDNLAAAQAGIAIATGSLVLLVTYFLVRLWGWRAGMLGGAVLALDPFLIAHSRVIHTDALLALLLLLSVVSLLAAFPPGPEPPRRRYLVVSAVACALAVLTKIFALAILPFVGAYIIYAVYRHSKRWQNTMQYGLLWITVFIISLITFWPALWVNAGQTLRYVASGVTQYSEDRRVGETTAQWWYYAREGFFRLTAPITLLAAAGIILARRNRDHRLREATFTLLAAGLSYAIILSLRGEQSDRYILFTLLTIDLMAVYGLKILTDWFKQYSHASSERLVQRAGTERSGAERARQYPARAAAPGQRGEARKTAGWAAIIVIAYLAITAARLHPYYLAHYNRLYPIEADHKLGWGEGLEQAAQYMETHHPGAEVASYYSTVFSHFYRSGATVGLTGDTNADYLVLYRSMFERGPAHPDTDLIQQYVTSGRYQPEHVITVNGLPYVWIFERK